MTGDNPKKPLDGDLVDTVIRVINGVGFPIVVSIALFWFNIESLKNQSELLADFSVTMRHNTELTEQLLRDSAARGAISERVLIEIKELREMKK